MNYFIISSDTSQFYHTTVNDKDTDQLVHQCNLIRVNYVHCTEGLVKEEYLITILGLFSAVFHETCCGSSLEAPHRGASNEYPQRYVFMQNKKSYSKVIPTCRVVEL